VNLANPLDLALLVALIAAGVLGYIAAMGWAYRHVRGWFEPWDPVTAGWVAMFWPLLALHLLCGRVLWRPLRWAWRLGAAPRVPKATARECKGTDP